MLGSEPLLGNLTHLYIHLMDFNGQAVYPRLIIGPKLQMLHISHDPDGAASPPFSIWSNLSCTLSTVTELQSLTFSTDIRRDDRFLPGDMQILLPAFRAPKSIRRLAIPIDLDLATLQHFANSTSLVEFEFSVSSAIIHDFLSTSSLVHIFEHIEELEIETDDIGAVQLLLQWDGFENLHTLHLNRNNPRMPCNLHNLFAAFSHNNRAIDIKHVSAADMRRQLTPIPAVHASHTLSPLWTFTNVTTLSIDMNESILLDDYILNSMVSRWPHLQSLQLYDWRDPTLTTPSSITLNGMLTLAECHDLRSLALRVNAYESIPDISMTKCASSGRKLEHFCLCRSPAQRPYALARFFQMIFPNLINLSYGYDRDHTEFASIENISQLETEYFECWREVWRLLTDGK